MDGNSPDILVVLDPEFVSGSCDAFLDFIRQHGADSNGHLDRRLLGKAARRFHLLFSILKFRINSCTSTHRKAI